MNRPRALLLLAVVPLAVACGTAAHSAATSAPSSAAAPAAPAGCSQALALLPAQAPSTSSAAGGDSARLGGVRGTTVDAMRDTVAADLSKLSLDLITGGGVTGDVSQFNADAQALRSYCA